MTEDRTPIPAAGARSAPPATPAPAPHGGRSGLSLHPLALPLLVGLAQGIALTLLAVWPDQADAPLPGLLLALRHLAWTLPLAWYVGDPRQGAAAWRLAVAVAVALLLAGLDLHHTASEATALSGYDTTVRLGCGLLGLVLVLLSCGVQPPPLRLAYAPMFAHAWRVALALPLAALLTGLFWTLLWAAAWLLDSIGLPLLRRAIAESTAFYLLGLPFFGLALGGLLQRTESLAALRRLLLPALAWFLPPALGFALLWLVSVVAVGVHPLFATQQAAFYIFWFCGLCIAFANAAFGDGGQAPPLPPALARACAWAWLAVPVLAMLGGWALLLRVQQYGWTVQRVWGAAAGLLVLLYGLAYAASAHRRAGWLPSIARGNMLVALLLALALALLLSPVADSRRLSARSQAGRLLAGAVPVDAFDWAYLRSLGPYGAQALQALAASAPAPVAQRARQELLVHHDAAALSAHQRQQRLEVLDSIELLPPGSRLEPGLRDWLAAAGGPLDFHCLPHSERCVLWLLDLDGDGRPELLAAWGHGELEGARVYAAGAAGWSSVGEFRGFTLSMDAWREGIRQGRFRTAAPRWRDLLVDGERLRLNP